MKENLMRFERFENVSRQIVSGKFAEAEERMNELLRLIVADDKLTELFTVMAEGFDYPACKGELLAGNTAPIVANHRNLLAFIFCLMAEIDGGTLKFYDFLLENFYDDGSYTASYALFVDRLYKRFDQVMSDCLAQMSEGIKKLLEREEPTSEPSLPEEDLVERTVQKNYVYQGKILSLRCDDAELSDGTPCKREIVEHSGGAGVLCVKNGKVLLVRQYRYAYGEVIYEIPAGKLNEGEDPAFSACRELKEETGVFARLEKLFVLYPTPGYTNEKIHLFRAVEIEEGERALDEGEFLNAVWLPLDEVYAMLDEGKICDAKTVVSLLWLKNQECK